MMQLFFKLRGYVYIAPNNAYLDIMTKWQLL